MKFRVTGSNRDTAARMVLEFEAENRAAAERKAIQSGMNVNHIQDITDREESDPSPARVTHRGQDVGSGVVSKMLSAIIFLIVAAGIVWLFREKLGALIRR